MASRRKFLRIGIGAAAALGAAAVWRAWDQGVFSTGTGPAYEAWNTWEAEPAASPQRLVHAAILAASPHNTQPWRFHLGPASVDLFADHARKIGTIDPDLRELHIGLGCALENLLLAASAEGLEHRVGLFPNPADVTHAARVQLQPGPAVASPLYAAIPHRHTNRGAYDTARSLEPAVFETLQALGHDLPLVSVRWFTGAESRRKVGELIVQATEAIIADPEQSRDSSAWYRATWGEIQARRDGLTVDAQALPAWLRVAAKVLPPISRERSDQIWLQSTRDVQVASATAYGILVVRDPRDNSSRIQGGRLWQRMHLWAQTKRIAMQPLNQLPERADRERSLGLEARFGNALAELVGDAGWQALMPFRLGYPTVTALPSPRRHVAEVIVA